MITSGQIQDGVRQQSGNWDIFGILLAFRYQYFGALHNYSAVVHDVVDWTEVFDSVIPYAQAVIGCSVGLGRAHRKVV